MNGKGHGQLRRSQVITTFGPGALIDQPDDFAIVGGLDTWGGEASLSRIDEPRLSAKLASVTGVPDPRLYAPPLEPQGWQNRQRGIRRVALPARRAIPTCTHERHAWRPAPRPRDRVMLRQGRVSARGPRARA